MKDTQRKTFTCRLTTAAEPMPDADWHASTAILAKLIARVYAREHPDLFGPNLDRLIGGQTDGN